VCAHFSSHTHSLTLWHKRFLKLNVFTEQTGWTYAWITSQKYISHDVHGWVTPRVQTSHVTQYKHLSFGEEFNNTFTWASHVTCANELRHTCGWAMSHIWRPVFRWGVQQHHRGQFRSKCYWVVKIFELCRERKKWHVRVFDSCVCVTWAWHNSFA